MSHMTLREPLGHGGPLLILSLHEHDLKWQKATKTFKCNGCNQDGKGGKYECDKCQFYLHEKCTLPPSTIVCVGREFRFHHRVPRDMKCDGNKCDACNKVVRGFCYSYSGNRDHVVHPCCANLPPVLHSKNLKLYLSKNLSQPCIKCQKEGPGWSYSSKSHEHNLHVACAKAWAAEKVRKKQAQIPEKVPPKNQHDVKGGGGVGQILKYAHLVDVVLSAVDAAFLGGITPFIEAVVN